MNKKQISYVFAMINRLDYCLEGCKSLISIRTEKTLLDQLDEFEKVLRKMRSSANNLQMEVARGDELAASRSIKIAYGLNQMVSSNLITTFINLANKNAPQAQKSKMFYSPVELVTH